jgi:6-pyruvoyltetrahydropterin/6-carboxytetrahydropterin synthase
VGLSAAFRQWRAESHCRFIHGYALQIRLEFEATELDKNKWVVDFGSLKPVKSWLEEQFDHRTLVAFDDPEIAVFQELHDRGIIDMNLVPGVGCESFATYVAEWVAQWLIDRHLAPRVKLALVEVREHAANSAIWLP